jgi:hypothetical protein
MTLRIVDTVERFESYDVYYLGAMTTLTALRFEHGHADAWDPVWLVLFYLWVYALRRLEVERRERQGQGAHG